MDEDRTKMSKSKGNVISPTNIVNKYGIDSMRWWIGANTSRDSSIPVNSKALQFSVETVQKLRNILKYLVGTQRRTEKPFPEIDLSKLGASDIYFLNSLIQLEDKIKAMTATYDILKVCTALDYFITNNLSAEYIHTRKDRLYCASIEDSTSSANVLLATFCVLNKHLWPIVPFLVEECWSYYGKICCNQIRNSIHLNKPNLNFSFVENEPFYKTPIILPDAWRNNDFTDTIDAAFNLKDMIKQKRSGFKAWQYNVDASVRKPIQTNLEVCSRSTSFRTIS